MQPQVPGLLYDVYADRPLVQAPPLQVAREGQLTGSHSDPFFLHKLQASDGAAELLSALHLVLLRGDRKRLVGAQALQCLVPTWLYRATASLGRLAPALSTTGTSAVSGVSMSLGPPGECGVCHLLSAGH